MESFALLSKMEEAVARSDNPGTVFDLANSVYNGGFPIPFFDSTIGLFQCLRTSIYHKMRAIRQRQEAVPSGRLHGSGEQDKRCG